MTLEEAYLFLRVSPLQCLTSLFMTSSPFPSHPTGRSVFPNPAVRQSSSHGRRRLSLVPDDSAPNVNDAQGIQSPIRVFLPPQASALTAIVQVTAKASVDESLQAPESVAGIGVTIVVHPSPHRLIHLLHKLRGLLGGPPLGEAFDPSSDVALGGLTGMDVDAEFAAVGGASFHELKPDEVKPFGQLRNPGFIAIDCQSHSHRNPLKRLKSLRCIFATDQNPIVRIAMQRGPQFLWVAPPMPYLVQQVEVDIAVERRNRRSLRNSHRRRLRL